MFQKYMVDRSKSYQIMQRTKTDLEAQSFFFFHTLEISFHFL